LFPSSIITELEINDFPFYALLALAITPCRQPLAWFIPDERYEHDGILSFSNLQISKLVSAPALRLLAVVLICIGNPE
jgi:hypothetical protein